MLRNEPSLDIVGEARDGRRAVDLVAELKPDLLLMDVSMPDMNGFKVQAHLAQKYAALPVIIVTGHDLPTHRERAMAGGASAFLRKPVHERTLLDAISTATSCAPLGTNTTS